MYPALAPYIQTGDWIFKQSTADISKWIRKFTFSKVNHVAIVYDQAKILETDLKYHQSVLHSISHIQEHPVVVIRPKFYKPGDDFRVRNLCRLYTGRPYSLWDVVANGLFFWMKDELRAKVLGFISNKTFMKCDELVARITWEVTRHESLKDWEGLTPGRLLEIAYSNPADYEVVLNTL